MSWETREVKQRLRGSITYTKRDLCTLLVLADVWSCEAACVAGRASGPWGSVQVLPCRSSPSLSPLILTALSLMWYSILLKNQNILWLTHVCFLSFMRFHTFLCWISLWTWLDFLGVLQHFLSVHSSPLCLRSPRSVPGCSNKYDKWGYRCLQNELWSESLWCLTLLMKYLDKSMYSHFVLRKNTLFCYWIHSFLL